MWCGYGRRRIITTGFWPGNIEYLLRVLALVGLIDVTCLAYLGFEGNESWKIWFLMVRYCTRNTMIMRAMPA